MESGITKLVGEACQKSMGIGRTKSRRVRPTPVTIIRVGFVRESEGKYLNTTALDYHVSNQPLQNTLGDFSEGREEQWYWEVERAVLWDQPSRISRIQTKHELSKKVLHSRIMSPDLR